jgi:hypothetical protein
MKTTNLKQKLIRKLDNLDESQMEELYGLVVNWLNGKKELKEWILLSDSQKQGIMDAIEEIDSGFGRAHEDVVNEMRKKYPDAG